MPGVPIKRQAPFDQGKRLRFEFLNSLNHPKNPKPFLKWVGGKSQIIEKIKESLPDPSTYKRYFEPFLGGGAVYFRAIPSEKKAFLNDVNENLIGAYSDIRNNLDGVIERLAVFAEEFLSLKTEKQQKEYFYNKRGLYNSLRINGASVERTALLMFLNKTCYNGVYRENSKGEFNVPIGRNTTNILDIENIRLVSQKLKNAKMHSGDYKKILKEAKRGDLVYLDPPYHPISTTANFTKYNKLGFTEKDQKEVRDVFVDLHERGCFVLLSNSGTSFINNLFSDYNILNLSVGRNINCMGQLRKPVEEVLIKNY